MNMDYSAFSALNGLLMSYINIQSISIKLNFNNRFFYKFEVAFTSVIYTNSKFANNNIYYIYQH